MISYERGAGHREYPFAVRYHSSLLTSVKCAAFTTYTKDLEQSMAKKKRDKTPQKEQTLKGATRFNSGFQEINPDKQIEWVTYGVYFLGAAIALGPPLYEGKFSAWNVFPATCVLCTFLFIRWAIYQPHSFTEYILNLHAEGVREEEVERRQEIGPSQGCTIDEQEMKILRYFERIVLSEKDPLTETFTMVGGRPDVAEQQIGFTSTRYHLSFLGYAVALACQQTPAYTGLAKQILKRLIELLLDYRCWSYVHFWWKGAEAHPFYCSENIMYTGHLLMLCTLYESLTGDNIFAKKDGIVAVAENGEVFKTCTMDLANHLSKLSRKSPSGGIACEPSCVFPPCQSHHLFSFRLLEAMHGQEIANFTAERIRWERYMLKNMRASIPSGALKIFVSERLNGAIPVGHPGNDGWVLTYMYAYTSKQLAIKELWNTVGRSRLSLGRWMDSLRREHPRRAKDRKFPAPDSCCNALNIPGPTWTAFLFPFLAQLNDASDGTQNELKGYLESHYLVEMRKTERDTPCSCIQNSGRHDDSEFDPCSCRAEAYIECGIEWSIASTANYLMGLTLQKDPSALRRLANNPKHKYHFTSYPYISRAVNADIYAASVDVDTYLAGTEGTAGSNWFSEKPKQSGATYQYYKILLDFRCRDRECDCSFILENVHDVRVNHVDFESVQVAEAKDVRRILTLRAFDGASSNLFHSSTMRHRDIVLHCRTLITEDGEVIRLNKR